MIRLSLAAALAAASMAAPASAVTFVSTPGSVASYAAPTGGVTIDFNGALPAGVTLTGSGYAVTSGTGPTSAAPAFNDGSAYIAVGQGGAATLQTSGGYQLVSLFLGSIDSFNVIDVLSTTGAVIATFNGSQFTAAANGDQSLPATNRRITFYRDATDALIGGLRLRSNGTALEADNVVFAVPEPSTWAMLLVGFGLVAAAMRMRRPRVNIVYA